MPSADLSFAKLNKGTPICGATQLWDSILYLAALALHSAALMINAATSLGGASIATWLDGTSIVVALAASA